MLLLFFIVFLLYVNVILGYEEFKNVVYLKKVIFSFEFFLNFLYLGLKVVNGILIDFVIIGFEKYFWLIIDLGVIYEVYEIEVFVRSGCCGKLIV